MKSKNNRQALSLKKSRRVKGGSGNSNKQKNMAEKIVLGDPYLLNYMLEYTKIDIPFVVVIKYTESDGDDTIYGKGTKDNYKSEIIKTILDNQYEELIEDVFDKKITNTKQKLIDIVHKRFYFYEYWEAKAFVSGEWIDVDISLDEIVEIYISKNNINFDSSSNNSGSNNSSSYNSSSYNSGTDESD